MRHIVVVATCLAAACAAVPSPAPAPEPTVETLAMSSEIPSAGRLGGVATDAAGNVYVSNFGASVWRVSPDGELTELSNQIRGTSGNAVGADGRLYQASFVGNAIARFDADGAIETFADRGLNGPVGVAVDDAGQVYVCNCNGNSISVASVDGQVRTLADGPLFACPNGITIGPDGAAYVVNFSNPHVLRVSASGDVTVVATFPGSGNAHIAYARGAFYVSRIHSNEIVRLDPGGSFARFAGTGELGNADGSLLAAELSRPNGIAASADGSYLYVNTINGEWRGEQPTTLSLRRIGPIRETMSPPATNAIAMVGAADLESIEIAVGDLVFDALAAGPPDGELVLLLHGFPQTSYAFRHQLRVLGNAGYRAVAPDQRGYSPRARPAGVAAYAMNNLVGDVIGMADALGAERFHLVGHDWGGAVAWVTALRHRDRLASLTVLSTPHFAALSAARTGGSDQAQRSSYFNTWSQPGAEEAFLADDAKFLRGLYANLEPDAVDRYMDALGNPDALRAALAWYAAAFGGSTPSAPAAAAPPPVRVPTLYVWSTADQSFGRDAALATAQHVDAPYRFEVIDGIGHWIPEHAAERASTLLLEQIRGFGAR